MSIDHGVPLFLQQLVQILRTEQITPHVNTTENTTEPAPTPAPTEIGRAAAVNGGDLLRLGYSIDQVVHNYGDVCQSVTQLAAEKALEITTNEFSTLNRCLDDAIADAVTAFGSVHQVLISDQAETLQQRLHYYSVDHQRLVDIALKSFSAIRTGHVGVTGATGTLLLQTLEELRSLAERTLPEIRQAYNSVSPIVGTKEKGQEKRTG